MGHREALRPDLRAGARHHRAPAVHSRDVEGEAKGAHLHRLASQRARRDGDRPVLAESSTGRPGCRPRLVGGASEPEIGGCVRLTTALGRTWETVDLPDPVGLSKKRVDALEAWNRSVNG